MITLGIAVLLAAQEYSHDLWKAWNSFEEGSWVEFESPGTNSKTTTLLTMEKKSADAITVRTEMTMEFNGKASPPQSYTWEVRRAAKSLPGPSQCAQCKKRHPGPLIQSLKGMRSLKIADKEFRCHRQEMTTYGCLKINGKLSPTEHKTTSWYCEEIPGHLVRTETTDRTMTILRFEVK